MDNNNDFILKYGTWALVTGAARKLGIGYEFAKQLANKGLNLVLTDVLENDLKERANELITEYGVKVKIIVLDVSQKEFITKLTNFTKDIDLGLLVCNHMFITPNTPTFLEDSLENHYKIIAVNAQAYMCLLHTYGRMMREKNRGGIILVSSMGGLHGTPFTAHYSANKAYQLMLGESVWYELKNTAVDVLVLTPGLTNTYPEGMKDYNKNLLMKVAPVVTETLEQLGKKHLVIPGWLNKITAFFMGRLLSRKKAIQMIGENMEQGLKK